MLVGVSFGLFQCCVKGEEETNSKSNLTDFLC